MLKLDADDRADLVRLVVGVCIGRRLVGGECGFCFPNWRSEMKFFVSLCLVVLLASTASADPHNYMVVFNKWLDVVNAVSDLEDESEGINDDIDLCDSYVYHDYTSSCIAVNCRYTHYISCVGEDEDIEDEIDTAEVSLGQAENSAQYVETNLADANEHLDDAETMIELADDWGNNNNIVDEGDDQTCLNAAYHFLLNAEDDIWLGEMSASTANGKIEDCLDALDEAHGLMDDECSHQSGPWCQ
ncbi:MAG: hypothetical protein ACYTEQ_24185 [Planctomycetota bacterium]